MPNVRVPWVVGTSARSGAAPADRPAPDRPTRCVAKAARIEADIVELDRLREAAGDARRRERLEASIALQRRRVGWLATYAVAARGALEARLAVIHGELGADGREYLVHGLPARLANDQRFMGLLAEAAIVSFALEA